MSAHYHFPAIADDWASLWPAKILLRKGNATVSYMQYVNAER